MKRPEAMTELEAAMTVVANARPEDVMRIEMHRAVADVDFMAEVRRGVPEPGVGAVDPRNQMIAAAAARSVAEALERDRYLSSQRETSRAELAEQLAAGQAPASVAAIKASIR